MEDIGDATDLPDPVAASWARAWRVRPRRAPTHGDCHVTDRRRQIPFVMAPRATIIAPLGCTVDHVR